MSRKTVFISYSHDSDEHRERVLALSNRLRADGIETVIDQYENGVPAEGWPRWMLNQLDKADFVLVVCTETYYRRFRGREESGQGRGVDWEGALITLEMYNGRSRTLKFVPVVFAPPDEKFIPEPLRGYTCYTLNSEDEYQKLYDFLLDQAGVEPHPMGELKIRPRRQGTVLAFGEPPPADIRRTSIPPREFKDDRVRSAALALDQARAEKSLTMRTLVGTLDRLFERDTFRREPSVGLCKTQEWHSRLHSGLQTLLLFEGYDSFVEVEARSGWQRYRDLTAAISRYCLNMAAYLFHPPIGISELRPLVGTVEFINQVREKKKWFEGGVDLATCQEIDPHLGNAIGLMKQLHDEFSGDADSSKATPVQP